MTTALHMMGRSVKIPDLVLSYDPCFADVLKFEGINPASNGCEPDLQVKYGPQRLYGIFHRVRKSTSMKTSALRFHPKYVIVAVQVELIPAAASTCDLETTSGYPRRPNFRKFSNSMRASVKSMSMVASLRYVSITGCAHYLVCLGRSCPSADEQADGTSSTPRRTNTRRASIPEFSRS